MKTVFYDLHIHSVLSPCADDGMTPNNIVLMAKIKGLDMISVTDHNSACNVRVITKLCEQHGILLIPGIEIETVEGVHLLAYVKQVDQIEELANQIELMWGNIQNRPEFFGNQWVMNEEDEVVAEVEPLLVQSTKLTCYEVVQLIHHYQGIVIAAHINKKAHSILTHLGFIPENLLIDGVELNASVLNQSAFKNQGADYLILVNSDAHTLGDMSERENKMELMEKSWEGFFNYLMEGRK